MFNDYNNEVKDTRAAQYFGLGVVRVLAMNPTLEQLDGIIGANAKKFNTTYDVQKGFNEGSKVRPVTIWLTDKDTQVSPIIKTINLENEHVKSRSSDRKQYYGIQRGDGANGPYAMFTFSYLGKADTKDKIEVGNTINLATGAGKKYTFEIQGEARGGEEALYSFYRVMIGWKDDERFVEAMKKESLDFDSIYGGNFDGLHKLVENFGEEGFVGLFSVKISDRGPRQSFVMKSDTWMSTREGVTQWHIDRMKSYKETQERAGYGVTNDAFTLRELMPYDEEIANEEVPVDNEPVDSWT